jgi:ribosome biogenesis GTPase
MDLRTLGLNNWFKKRLDQDKLTEYKLARVTAVNKESYIIRGEANEARAELTGKRMYSASSPLDYPTVGDWVYVQYFDDDSFAVIHEVISRKAILKRKTSGNRIEFQLIAANIDTAFIMQSLDSNYNLQRLERYLVVINESNIRPIILLSKSDLLPQSEINEKLSEIQKRMPDVMTISFSNLSSSGVDAVSKLLVEGETFCLLGSSGVGKTTLLNKLIGEEVFDTQTIREKDSKGRHTTSRRQLTVLDNGAILIDTPGMRELGAFSVESGIDTTFNEITELSKQCRFTNCSHAQEEGCAVLAALNKGTIPEKRYENFMKMSKESKYYSMSYLEKRQKDKNFGKMIKSVMKNHKKK